MSKTDRDANLRHARAELRSIPEQLAAVDRMSKRELHAKFVEVFGRVSASQNGDYLRKKIKYRIQEMAEGRSLSERAKTRLAALAETSSIRQHPKRATRLTAEEIARVPTPVGTPHLAPRRDPRLPAVGTVLRREHGGTVHEVSLTEDGFSYRGRPFTSLSTIAKEITGSVWNGFVFFGLSGRRPHGDAARRRG